MENLMDLARELVENYGYLGIAVISFTESIIQPVPPDIFISGGSMFGLNPMIATIVATVGSVSGAIVGYFLGKFLGEPAFKKLFKEKWYNKGEILFRKYGIWAVIVAGLTPIPFKAVCWLAGIFEMPLGGFIIASILGRFPRFLFVAFFSKWISSLF